MTKGLSELRADKDLHILYENDNFIVSCRKEYLKDKAVYFVVDQKIKNVDYLIPLVYTGYTNRGFEDNFSKLVKTIPLKPLKDRRYEGFYCCICKKFSKEQTMGFGEETVYSKDKKEVYLINKHYDGCRGWD